MIALLAIGQPECRGGALGALHQSLHVWDEPVAAMVHRTGGLQQTCDSQGARSGCHISRTCPGPCHPALW